MKQFTMLVKRETWEHPAFWVAMLVVAVLLVGGGVPNAYYHAPAVGFDNIVTSLQEAPEGSLPVAYSIGSMGVAVFFNMIMVFVLFFYLLDSLYADRKDRSVLFWKSLPVTDSTTVLSKLATAMFVIPGYALAAILATIVVFAIAMTPAIWIGGGGAWGLLWSQIPILSIATFLAYAFVVQSLWWFPLIGWGMLASAWARRTPFLWTVLPPVVIILLEETIFRTERFAEILGHRFVGVFPLAFRDQDFEILFDDLHHGDLQVTGNITDLINPTPLLSEPGLWIGFAVGVVFIAGAIWLRRYRDEA